MIDWKFSPEIQALYDRVVAMNTRLQAELGIKSMTIEERAERYKKKKEEQLRLEQLIKTRRPLPKWKV